MLLRVTVQEIFGSAHLKLVDGKIVLIGVYLNGPGAGNVWMSTTLMVRKLSLKTISIFSELVPVIPRFAKSRIILAS